jgi:hypothetical protein
VWRAATVGISNGHPVSGMRTTTECDGAARLAVAVGDFHSAEPLCDSLRPSQERASQAWPRPPRPWSPSAPARVATRASAGGPRRPRSTSPRSVLTAPWRDGR